MFANQAGHQTRPARLVRCAQPHPIIAVVVLVEEKQIAPIRVGLKAIDIPIKGTPPIVIAYEQVSESSR